MSRKKIARPTHNEQGVSKNLNEQPGPELAGQGSPRDLLKNYLTMQHASTAAIRNGVKTERDTQPVQVRMLKAQIKVLKQVAEQEDRTASDVIRDLVDAYIGYCLTHWPEGDKLDILRATVRANGYYAERMPEAEKALAYSKGEPYREPYSASPKPSWMTNEEYAKEARDRRGPSIPDSHE